MSKLLLLILILLVVASEVGAATFYMSTTGNDGNTGADLANAWATFAHANGTMVAGDTLLIADGTYDQALHPTASGSAGNYIRYKAINDYMVVLEPTSDPGAATINIFSCPDCGTAIPTVGYIWFEGLIARGYGENGAVDFGSGDDTPAAGQTHNIVVKKCGFYGNAQETNSSVFVSGPGFRDSLIEDIFTYGRGRKSIELFSSVGITIRRAVVRYDYWEGDDYKPDDPRVSFTGYNVHDCVFENIIAIDSAPDPPGTHPDRSGIAIEGNETPGGLSNSQNNKYLGCVNLNNYGNGVESDSGSSDPDRDIVIRNMLIWDTHDAGEGLDVHGNDDSSEYDFLTIGRNDRAGVLVNQYPGHPITNDSVTHVFSTLNGLLGFNLDSAQVPTFENNTATANGEGGDLEASYAPDISTRFLDPVMVTGHERGATIVNRYVDGVQTVTPLWPYPNEAVIKTFMCNSSDLSTAHRVAANGTHWEPGWCATGKTLTAYIWEYDGATCPADICAYNGPVRSAGGPTVEQAQGTTSITLTVTTDVPSTCTYGDDGATGTAYPLSYSMADTSNVHTATISGLSDGGSYSRAIRCAKDSDSQANDTDMVVSWTVASAAVNRTLTVTDPGNGDVITCSDSDLSTPISCGAGNTACTATVADGGQITGLTATAAAGRHYTAWTGDVTGTTNPTTVNLTMSANRSVGATFAADSAVIHTVVTGTGNFPTGTGAFVPIQ